MIFFHLAQHLVKHLKLLIFSNKFSQENYKGFNITKYLDKEYSNIDLIISEKDRNLIGY